MSVLTICFAALACMSQAAPASPPSAASCMEGREVRTSGAALLQFAGDLGKRPPPIEEEEIEELQTSVKGSSNSEKKPKGQGFDFGGDSKKKDDNENDLDLSNNNNNNNNFNLNDNNNNDNDDNDNDNAGTKDNKGDDVKGSGTKGGRLQAGDDAIDFKGKDNEDDLNFNNNGNNLNDNSLDAEIEKGGDDVKKSGGENEKGKGGDFNFGNSDDNIGDNSGKENALDNFDFGGGAINKTENIKASTEGLKRHVDKAVSKVSKVLEDASAQEKAVRKALDNIDTSKGAEDIKKVAEAMQNSLKQAQDKVKEAQDQLKELQSGIKPGKSAASLSANFRMYKLLMVAAAAAMSSYISA